MTLQNDIINYCIELPASTNLEVIEWFQFINNYGDLSLELVKLVQNYINQNKSTEGFEPQNINTDILVNQTNFFDSIYNCGEAASAVFCEEKKAKKKMLSV